MSNIPCYHCLNELLPPYGGTFIGWDFSHESIILCYNCLRDWQNGVYEIEIRQYANSHKNLDKNQ